MTGSEFLAIAALASFAAGIAYCIYYIRHH